MEGSDPDLRGAGPEPSDCVGPDDIGKLHHDVDADVWYECMYDARRQHYTWVIIPPAD